jgi:hypothetical protein
METKLTRDERDTAFMSPALPCNPLPFLRRMQDIVNTVGTDGNKSIEYKSNMFILLAQTFGLISDIDMYDLYVELKNEFCPKDR